MAREGAFELDLTQDGDMISGVACQRGYTGAPVVSNIPVTGDYPNIVWHYNAQITFSGKYEKGRDEIPGNFGNAPIRYYRGSDGRCGG